MNLCQRYLRVARRRSSAVPFAPIFGAVLALQLWALPAAAQSVGLGCTEFKIPGRPEAALACTLANATTGAGAGVEVDGPDLADEGRKYAYDITLEGPQETAGLVEALGALQEKYPDSFDMRAGLSLRGSGAGADAAIAASLELPADFWRQVVVRVHARNPSSAQQRAFRRAGESGNNSHIYYEFTADADSSDAVEPYLQTCQEYSLACSGTWGEAAASADAGSLTGTRQAVRNDMPLPSFTRSSANRWGPQGNYNLGLEWRARGIVNSKEKLVLPLRYRHSEAAGQPEAAVVDVTLRRGALLNRSKGMRLQWELLGSEQRGVAQVSDGGVLSIEGLALESSVQFSRLRVQPAPPQWKLVYTRQPRARTSVPGTPVKEAANWQHATDVGRINGGLSEADVVIDDLEGRTRVIHDCTGRSEICVAHEARVSPDGSKIVYSVGYGYNFTSIIIEGINMGIQDIAGLAYAKLWIFDLNTGKKWPIPNQPKNVIDRQPEWLNNDKIVFVSNRGGTYPFRNPVGMHQGTDQYGRGRCFNPPYCVSQEYGYGPGGMSMQVWTMNVDGTNARNISPHEQMALAPAVMSNGDILYSCWNSHESKSHDAKTSHSNRPNTSKNKWWLCRTDGNGADATVLLNGHKTSTLKTKAYLDRGVTGGEGRSQLRSIRSVAEIFPDKLAITNYYRSNHVGSMGIIFAMDYGDPHVEGCSTANCYPDTERRSSVPGSGHYVPSSLLPVTPYGTDQDIQVRRDARGRAMGKAGYPAPLPNTDKAFLITHARGSCYEITRVAEANRRAMGGEPTCQKAIYKVKVEMVTDPFDKRQMEMLAGGNQWHAWDARAIATYQELYGKPLPDQPEPLDENGACYLQVVDAREAELYPSEPQYDWLNNLYKQCAFQGCAVNTEDPTFHAKNLHNFSVFLPEMWDFSYSGGRQKDFTRYVGNTGHKSIATLGSQPLQEDGSVKMRVPCETPLIMAGTDSDGMVIAWDVMLHSLRAGETRTCHGCHDGHSEERAAKLKLPAAQRFARTLAFNTNPAMPQQSPPVTFDDVRPILERRCTGCHKDMNDRNGLLYSRVAQDYEQHDWPWAKKQPAQGQHGRVEHVLIRRGGQGFSKGDQLIFAPGGAAGFVESVGAGGKITGIRLTNPGDGYDPLSPVGVASAGGRGAKLTAMTDRFDISRPYSSKWVARFARDSLLYWKCVGARMDGRKDSQYPNDIDFGPEHASGATAEECRIIGRWIDAGIQHVL